jgi:hypothetical protein
LVSGSTLIIGEPHRSLENPVFMLKMGLLVLAVFLTGVVHAPLGANAEYWAPANRKALLRVVIGVSLVTWTAIIFAGRWIAYV